MARTGNRRDDEQLQMENLLGSPTLRTALGFSAIALLAALILAPALDTGSETLATLGDDDLPNQIDRTITGSIAPPDQPTVTRPNGQSVRYTVRRSVLNSKPNEPCYIYENGLREGGC